MRKNRFLAIQKIAEQKKLNVDGGPDGDHAPKQTVSNRQIRNLEKSLFLDRVLVSGDPCSRRYDSKYMILKLIAKAAR